MNLRAIALAAAALAAAALLGTPTARGSAQKTETVFPAAGELTVNRVKVRSAPNPHAHVIKVMTQFRTDYRVQEMFAVALRNGTDGKIGRAHV